MSKGSDEKKSSLLQGYISEAELADELGLSLRRVRHMKQMRTGPPFSTFGQTTLYSRDAVLAWLKSLEVAPPRTRSNRAA
jgi:hypothetical protein